MKVKRFRPAASATPALWCGRFCVLRHTRPAVRGYSGAFGPRIGRRAGIHHHIPASTAANAADSAVATILRADSAADSAVATILRSDNAVVYAVAFLAVWFPGGTGRRQCASASRRMNGPHRYLWHRHAHRTRRPRRRRRIRRPDRRYPKRSSSHVSQKSQPSRQCT